MQDVPARRGSGGALSTTHRAGAVAAAELIARSASAHTRRVYASALGLLAAWLDGRRLDDASLAAYLGYLHQAGRAPATAALAVAAVRRAARDAGEEPPAGPLTRQGLEGFRRSAAADAPARRGQARGLTAEECAAVLATCGRPRRTGRRPRARRDGRARWRRRRHRPPLEDESGRRSSRRPAPGRRLRGRGPSQAATAPEPGDSVIGLGVDQVNRRFAAACAAAGLEGRRTSHGGRVGLAVELTARGAATHAVQLVFGLTSRPPSGASILAGSVR